MIAFRTCCVYGNTCAYICNCLTFFLKIMCPGLRQERFGISPSFAGCMEQLSKKQTYFMKKHLFFGVLRLKLFDAVVSPADSNGIVAECFVHGSLELHEHFLRIFKLMLVDGHAEERWKQTTFSMIPKTGDPTNPGNWRPLAILNITYKIFTRMVYKRVKPILEA